MSEKCKGTVKDTGLPCPKVILRTFVTPGYCFCHDPGITREMRQDFKRGKGLDTAAGEVARLRTPYQIMAYVELLLHDFKKMAPVMTVETVEVTANLLRIQMMAIKEQNARMSKHSKKEEKSPEWRDVG